jgi:ComF family protein
MAKTMADLDLSRPDVLLPVPLHRQRLRQRGFNQALELARPVSRRLCIPLDPWLAVRNKATIPQASLSPKDRYRNVRDAFQVKKDVSGLKIAIIDDVMTTGHTANALANTLKKAGAREISVWVFARA